VVTNIYPWCLIHYRREGGQGKRGRKKEEGRGKREEGRGKREEGRGKREEGRGKREEGRGK
jgi:hypothetical protein